MAGTCQQPQPHSKLSPACGHFLTQVRDLTSRTEKGLLTVSVCRQKQAKACFPWWICYRTSGLRL